jgi:hypothetical protein
VIVAAMIVALMIVPVMIVIVTKMPPKPRSRLSSASAGAATDSDAAIDIVDIKETKSLSSYGRPMFTAQSARLWSITGHRLMDLADAHVTLRRHV